MSRCVSSLAGMRLGPSSSVANRSGYSYKEKSGGTREMAYRVVRRETMRGRCPSEHKAMGRRERCPNCSPRSSCPSRSPTTQTGPPSQTPTRPTTIHNPHPHPVPSTSSVNIPHPTSRAIKEEGGRKEGETHDIRLNLLRRRRALREAHIRKPLRRRRRRCL